MAIFSEAAASIAIFDQFVLAVGWPISLKMSRKVEINSKNVQSRAALDMASTDFPFSTPVETTGSCKSLSKAPETSIRSPFVTTPVWHHRGWSFSFLHSLKVAIFPSCVFFLCTATSLETGKVWPRFYEHGEFCFFFPPPPDCALISTHNPCFSSRLAPGVSRKLFVRLP